MLGPCSSNVTFDAINIANFDYQHVIDNDTRSINQNMTFHMGDYYATKLNGDDPEHLKTASNSWSKIFMSVSNCLMVLNSSINFYIYYGKYRKYLPANKLLCTRVRNLRLALSSKTTSSESIEMKLKSSDQRREAVSEVVI